MRKFRFIFSALPGKLPELLYDPGDRRVPLARTDQGNDRYQLYCAHLFRIALSHAEVKNSLLLIALHEKEQAIWLSLNVLPSVYRKCMNDSTLVASGLNYPLTHCPYLLIYSVMRILIIEDDRLLEQTLALRLKEIGHEVILAENGKEALKTIHDFPHPDVLLCDVVLPELSGPSCIREMRKLLRSDHVRVIMMSALSDGETFIQKLEVNYDYYLSKPFTFGELNAILHEIKHRKTNSVH